MPNRVISNGIDRMLALLILAALLVGGYALARYVYVERLVAMDHELENAKKRQSRINSILASEKEFKKRIMELQKRVQSNQLFLNNSNAATAASELQNYLKQLVGRYSKAKISSIKPYPVKAYEEYSETSLEISLLGVSHDGLHALLYAIENNSPVVLVREIEVMLSRKRYRPMVKDEPSKTRMIATLVVSGFFREGAG